MANRHAFIGSVTGILGLSSYYFRPQGDSGQHSCGPKRSGYAISDSDLSERANIPPPLLYRFSQKITVVLTSTITRTFMYFGGRFNVIRDKRYSDFISHVKRREHGVPLITVSNHRSMLDDPAMMASILPLWMSMQPRYIRWSVCSQEFCFNPQLPSITHVFSGLGKVMPIWRGGGIDQKLWLNFARRAAAGDWCHVFPEGGIWQMPELGGRSNGRESEIGNLKWGVGKLIAHAPKRPIVVPFFHMGMEAVLPQHPDTKALLTNIPIPGHDVTVRFGCEIRFDDLIEEHERTHGPLWKYAASVDEDPPVDDFHRHWDSSPAEKALYSKITMRIETALRELNEESDKYDSHSKRLTQDAYT